MAGGQPDPESGKHKRSNNSGPDPGIAPVEATGLDHGDGWL
jgi:hypothetical protein